MSFEITTDLKFSVIKYNFVNNREVDDDDKKVVIPSGGATAGAHLGNIAAQPSTVQGPMNFPTAPKQQATAAVGSAQAAANVPGMLQISGGSVPFLIPTSQKAVGTLSQSER